MRADLQRYYGINLDEVGGSISVSHAAALSWCLPHGSLVLERINPKTKYTETEWLLLGILNSLREKPFDPFEPEVKPKHVSMSVSELAKRLSKPRREVKDGN